MCRDCDDRADGRGSSSRGTSAGVERETWTPRGRGAGDTLWQTPVFAYNQIHALADYRTKSRP